MTKFNLILLTPKGEFFRGEIESIRLKGVDGYFEILANHMDFITNIVPHTAVIKIEGKERKLKMDKAVVRVRKGQVTILADQAVWDNGGTPQE